MSKVQNADQLSTILESLSDVSVTLVADFFLDPTTGGLAVASRLAELGVTVFPVGAVGEDEQGQKVLHALQALRISTSGISKLKNYATPANPQAELIHGEHPALLNLVEHARKFAEASEALYVCDYGVGAASSRVLNFIKSKGGVREKTLAARSRDRIIDFEQLSTAIATEAEMERAIGIQLGGDSKKLAVAGIGMIQEMKMESLLAISGDRLLAFSGIHKPSTITLSSPPSPGTIDVLGAIFAAASSTGAEVTEAAQLAAQVSEFLGHRSSTGKRVRREELIAAVAATKSASRSR